MVATDSMKNIIHRQATNYQGNTAEGFLKFICEVFLDKYSHIDAVELTATEVPFDRMYSFQKGKDMKIVMLSIDVPEMKGLPLQSKSKGHLPEAKSLSIQVE